MASKNDHGFDKLTNRDVSFIAFCDELRTYVEEHHHFPNKHTAALNKIKYIRKTINEGTLEEWKRVMFEEIANSRDLSIHTGGRKRKGNGRRLLVVRISSSANMTKWHPITLVYLPNYANLLARERMPLA